MTRVAKLERITGTFTVPTLIHDLLNYPAAPDAFATMRNWVYGGAPIEPSIIAQALERFGTVFTQVYGSCEAPHPVLCLNQKEHATALKDGDYGRLRSAGREVASVEVKLIADGRPVAELQPGELWVRGANVMSGYWQDVAATAEVIQDGW